MSDASAVNAAAAIEVLEQAAGRLVVRGPLTFATARRARDLGLAKLAGARSWRVDCSGITAADSAGLAVLIDWLGVVSRAGGGLCYDSLPESLLGVARISEVEDLLKRGVGAAPG